MRCKQFNLTVISVFRLTAICIPLLMLLGAAMAQQPQHPPSKQAKGMPGALGTFDYRPPDYKAGVRSFWLDTDGVNPGVAGCHIGVKGAKDKSPNGRVFGEACRDGTVLIESNPDANVIHGHDDDVGHPDLIDCNAWCKGAKKAKAGVCTATKGPAPCATSARCECR
jgi:hypothetical protein